MSDWRWVAGAVAVVAVLTTVGVLWRRSRLPETKRGMKMMAQDRAGMARMSREFDRREELLKRAPFLTREELAAGAREMTTGDSGARDTWSRVFQAVGPSAAPVLLQAINDPSVNRTATGKEATVFKSLTRTLASIGSAEVIPVLAAWASSQDKDQRQHAALCIASTGVEQAVEPTTRFLCSDTDGDRTYAIMGIHWAVENKHVTPRFQSALFDEMSRMIEDATKMTDSGRDACRVIFVLDRERAAEQMASDRCLRLDHPLLHSILEELNNSGVTLPESLIAQGLELAKKSTEYPWTYVRSQLLMALAKTAPSKLPREIEDAMSSGDSEVRRGVARALRIANNLPEPGVFLFVENIGTLPRQVQHVVAALGFEAEVNNGGISQYFFNSAGDDSAIALEGFRAMGATEFAEILQRAIDHVGPRGASPDREVRMAWYAKLPDDKEELLDELSSRVFDDPDHLDLRITKYMKANAEVFREAAKKLPARTSD